MKFIELSRRNGLGKRSEPKIDGWNNEMRKNDFYLVTTRKNMEITKEMDLRTTPIIAYYRFSVIHLYIVADISSFRLGLSHVWTRQKCSLVHLCFLNIALSIFQLTSQVSEFDLNMEQSMVIIYTLYFADSQTIIFWIDSYC